MTDEERQARITTARLMKSERVTIMQSMPWGEPSIPSDNIHRATNLALHLANKQGCIIKFAFKGIELEAFPGDDAEVIVSEYKERSRINDQ